MEIQAGPSPYAATQCDTVQAVRAALKVREREPNPAKLFLSLSAATQSDRLLTEF